MTVCEIMIKNIYLHSSKGDYAILKKYIYFHSSSDLTSFCQLSAFSLEFAIFSHIRSEQILKQNTIYIFFFVVTLVCDQLLCFMFVYVAIRKEKQADWYNFWSSIQVESGNYHKLLMRSSYLTKLLTLELTFWNLSNQRAAFSGLVIWCI